MHTGQDMSDIDLGKVQVKAGVRTREQPNIDSPKNTMKNKKSFNTFRSLEIRVDLYILLICSILESQYEC